MFDSDKEKYEEIQRLNKKITKINNQMAKGKNSVMIKGVLTPYREVLHSLQDKLQRLTPIAIGRTKYGAIN